MQTINTSPNAARITWRKSGQSIFDPDEIPTKNLWVEVQREFGECPIFSGHVMEIRILDGYRGLTLSAVKAMAESIKLQTGCHDVEITIEPIMLITQ